MRLKIKTWLAVAIVAVGSTVVTMPVLADQLASPNYMVDETFFGTGGELDASSANYRSKQSAGELTVGNTSSASYQAQAGFNSDREPYLEFKVDATNVDIGTLVPGTPLTAQASFSIRSYLSSGYVVKTASDPPKNANYLMKTFNLPSDVDTSAEQFGINLAANTVPTAYGAAPSQQPDATFGFGRASPNYATPNKYMYAKDDTLAYSTTSTGQTNFTVSYLYNITNVTPAGTYTLNHVLVATATF